MISKGLVALSLGVDLAASELITLPRWEERPLGDRVRETAARVWQYWL